MPMFQDFLIMKMYKPLGLKEWSQDKSKLIGHQWDLVHHYLNIGNRPFGSASWTVVEANCHFTK